MVWTFGSFATLAVSGIIINIVIVSFYGAGALGVFNQVFALYAVLSQFSVGGIHFSVLKEISHNHQNKQNCVEIITSALILTSAIAGAVCLICFSCKTFVEDFFASSEVAAGFVLVIPGLFWFSLNKVLIMALNGFRLMKSYAFFQSLRYVLILVIILFLLVLQYEPSFLLISLTVTEVILFFLLFSYLHLKVCKFKFSACSLVRQKKHFFYGIKGFFSGVLQELNTRLGVIMLGFFLSDSSVGIYSFAAMLAEGFSQIPQVLRRNVDPLLGRFFASGRIGEIEEIAQKMKKLIWPFMGGVTILAVSLYPVLVKFISSPGENLMKSWGVFSIIMFGILLNAGYKPLIGIFLQGGQPGIHTLFTFWIVASNGLLNLLLIPYWGIYGAALATSLVSVIEAMAIIFYAKRQFDISLLGFTSSRSTDN